MLRNYLTTEINKSTNGSLAETVIDRIIEVRKKSLKQSLRTFNNVEHRLEFVATVHGVDFVNDSMASTINATWYALEDTKKQIIWIVGGANNSKNDYIKLYDLVQNKVKSIICIGSDNSSIIKTFGNIIDNIFEAGTMEIAVEIAYNISTKGDTVLLSPASASYDKFDGYEERGNLFKSIVKNL